MTGRIARIVATTALIAGVGLTGATATPAAASTSCGAKITTSSDAWCLKTAGADWR